jgi:hypothetical protein
MTRAVAAQATQLGLLCTEIVETIGDVARARLFECCCVDDRAGRYPGDAAGCDPQADRYGMRKDEREIDRKPLCGSAARSPRQREAESMGHRQAKRFGGLEIHDHLKLDR